MQPSPREPFVFVCHSRALSFMQCDVTAEHFRLSIAIRHVREMGYLLVEFSLPNDNQLILLPCQLLYLIFMEGHRQI